MSTHQAAADKPAFSIIIPVSANRDDAICSINSILSQTCQDFEIIIINYEIGKETGPTLELFLDDRIHYIDQGKTKGPDAAWKTGLTHANGAYLTHLAPGNILKPDCLERIQQETEKFPEEFVFISSRHGTQSDRASYYHHAVRTLTPPEFQTILLHYQLEQTPCGAFYKQTGLEQSDSALEAITNISDRNKILSLCHEHGCVLLSDPLWQNTQLNDNMISHHGSYNASPSRMREHYLTIRDQQRASLNQLLFRSVLRHIARADIKGLHHDIKLLRSRRRLSQDIWRSIRNYIYGLGMGRNDEKRKEQGLDLL